MTNNKDSTAERPQSLEASCRRYGLALTVQRRTIMDALASRDDHPSADQLYDTVRPLLPGISRTTVYRVLETLVEIGLVRKVGSPEARSRFDGNPAHHHHFFCSSCQQIRDIHEPLPDFQAVARGELVGCLITDCSVSYVGLCPECRERQYPSQGGPT